MVELQKELGLVGNGFRRIVMLFLPFHMAWLKMQMLLACSGLEGCEAALVEGSCVPAVAVS